MGTTDFTAVDAAMQAWRDALDALAAARGAAPAEWWALEQAVDDARLRWERAVADTARTRWTHAAIVGDDVLLCRIDQPGIWEDVTALDPCDLDADALIGLHGYRVAGPWETIAQGDGTECQLAPVKVVMPNG